MKRLTLLFLIVLGTSTVFSQAWNEAFYAPNDAKAAANFYEIQKDFNDYWEPFNVKGGYYFIDGVKHKAAGWKQFKRWEWFWETRVNQETGEFPNINPLTELQEFKKIKASSKADESNWVNMGPVTSDGGYAGIGRINCITFHPTDTNTFWIGAPSGGLWKTTDSGDNWEVLTDSLPVVGVSAMVLAHDYASSKTIYIATGDRDSGDNYSIGILKSTDDGVTWNETALKFNVSSRYRISRLLMDPNDSDMMYASTNGGIFKTSNGWTNYTQVVSSGIYFDMEFKPNCEDTLYAAKYDYYNEPQFYKSVDGGDSWNLKYSFPTAASRIELDVAESDSTLVYALACKTNGGLEGVYKSTNSGEDFTKIFDGATSGNNLLGWYSDGSDNSGQGNYDLTLSVSPVDENIIILGGVNSWKSIDGGLNWTPLNIWTSYSTYNHTGAPEVHADKHYMEYQNDSTFFEANDGGIYKTNNGGETWKDLTDGMIISQMYKLGVSKTVKDEVITGLQDNGSKLYESSTWWDVKGGDGMECFIDFTDENVQYATYVYGQIDRTTDHWNNWQNTVDITDNMPDGEEENGAWVTPYVINPMNSKALFLGYADVWKTTDRGDSWTKISNLSLLNKIRSMAIAPSDSNTLYITDFNNFYRTTDGGTSWTNLTSSLPSTSNDITYISIDDNDPTKLWITFSGYDAVKAFESTDGGGSWTDISSGLPSVPANTIIENKLASTRQLYAGTDFGVFFKDGDSDWIEYDKNLPSVVVTELEIHYDETTPTSSVLYASTYGRGLWKSNLASFALSAIQVNSLNGPFYVSDDSVAIVNIPFEINETFSSNTFTAYLSDATGDFSSQVEIGSLVSDIAGTIEGTIPAATVSGTGYKIKVISSSPTNESSPSDNFEIVLDNDSPVITMSSTEGVASSSAVIPIVISFSEEVSEFLLEDISITNGTSTVLNTSDNIDYSIDVTPTAEGDVLVDIDAGVAKDIVGNENNAADQFSINYDITSPDIKITSSETDTTANTPIIVKIQFTEKVSELILSDLSVTNGSASNLLVAETDSVWNVDVSPASGGLVAVDIDAGAVEDLAGNFNNAATQFSIIFNGSGTGIEDLKRLGIKIYPNPSSGKFTIESENNLRIIDVSILDLSGRIIFEESFSNSTKEVDISRFAKGLYILQLNVKNEKIISKILIE